MKTLYQENSPYYPRLKTDTFYYAPANRCDFHGFVDDNIRYIEKIQLLRTDLWKRFVQQYRDPGDFDNGWRGEYWGKMMRGACFTYQYTRNRELYHVLKAAVEDLLTCQTDDGRISSYPVEKEFNGWDIWCRKYVLLGLQYFLEICEDTDLSSKIVNSMCGHASYIMSHIGAEEEGKKPITAASGIWRGLNSSSLLEPIVRLYSITKEEKYLDFATHIVNSGGLSVANIFRLAYENRLYPYQYPVTKAYEMISCFEGLLEYYRITGEEWMKEAVLNFAHKVLESDYTIIGSSGCTHELFDHSTVRQANTNNFKIMQETCVTVTLMKFMLQLNLLTGNAAYMDAFETSLYNAYFGAINTDNSISAATQDKYPDLTLEPLAFDSYSPLTAETRGNGTGGMKVMKDGHYFGCCACIGAAGNGMISQAVLPLTGNGFALNLFLNGTVNTVTPAGNEATFFVNTDYPKSGSIQIELRLAKEEAFTILLRKPYWSKQTGATLNGIAVAEDSLNLQNGYYSLERTWKSGDVIEYNPDMRTEALFPIPYGHDILMTTKISKLDYVIPSYDEEDPIAYKHIALRRGPIILAQENRLGYSVDDPIDVAVNEDGYVDVRMPEKDIAPYRHVVEVQIPLQDGSFMTVTDYASAGKLWTQESKMAAWMLTK